MQMRRKGIARIVYSTDNLASLNTLANRYLKSSDDDLCAAYTLSANSMRIYAVKGKVPILLMQHGSRFIRSSLKRDSRKGDNQHSGGRVEGMPPTELMIYSSDWISTARRSSLYEKIPDKYGSVKGSRGKGYVQDSK